MQNTNQINKICENYISIYSLRSMRNYNCALAL